MKISKRVLGLAVCLCAVGGPVARGGVLLDAAQAAQAPRTSLPVGRGVASASDEKAGAQAGRAFDGSAYTNWQMLIPGGTSGWLEYRFDEDVRWLLTDYAVTSGSTNENRDPREWELQGSLDGSNWVKLETRKNQIFIGRRRANSFRLRMTEAYNRYRLIFASNGAETPVEIAEVNFTVKALAQPPDEVAAEMERGSAVVSWKPAESATGYTVRRASDPRGPYVILASGVQTPRYTDRGPFDDCEISYYTVSTDVNSVQGVMSEPASIATPAAAPTHLQAKTDVGRVVLEWTPSPKAAAYVVRRSLVKEGPYTVIGSLITAPAFTDEGLTAGTAYYYVVCGVANGKEGVDTAPASALFPPAVPTGLTAEPGKEVIALKWNTVALTKTYKIMRATSADGPWEALATVADDTAFTDKTVNVNKTYYYAVSAVNECGASAESAVVSASPLRPAAWWRR